MSPEGLPHEQPREGGAPAASLTLVRVQRRRSSLQPSRKAGDLTQRLMEEKAAASAAATPTVPVTLPPVAPPSALPEPALTEPLRDAAPTVIALPPPADEAFEPQHLDAVPEPTALAVEDESEPPLEPAFARLADVPLAAPAEPVGEMPQVEDHVAAPEPHAAPSGADALIDYWDELAGDRLFPALDQLDRERIAEYWPNTVLLTFGAGDMPRMTRLGEPDGEIEYNLMVTDWILSRGRQAAERAEALEEEQRFPVGRARARYRLVLLPCSNDGGRVDHMLCHVSRLAEQPKLSAVASFKRWLAS
jgi:hypothetical protein